MGRRTLLLIAALVVAALGTTGIFLYVNGVDERAAAGYDLVELLVATAPIAAGTPAQDAEDLGAFELRRFTRDSVEGLPALRTISQIRDLVAVAPIAVGSPILATQFGSPGESAVLPIPGGKLAVSLQLDDPQRVAGFVEPGSNVVVFFTSATPGSDGGQLSTRVLLPTVPVIAAGATTLVATEAGNGEQLTKALLTVAVDQKEAQKLVYAQDNGKITFGLINSESDIDRTEPGTTAGNLFE